MVVKLARKLSYFIAEECYKNQIISNKVNPNHYEFSTNQHTFVCDENNVSSTNYDVIELDFASIRNIKDYYSKLDKSKKYFVLWYYGEGMTPYSDDFKFLMDNGIKIYSSTFEPELIGHQNFVYDIAFSFHYFHFYNGSCYIDRENSERVDYPKKYKVGLYGLSKESRNI